MNNKKQTQKDLLHFRIAERGKLHSLDGNYKEALRHYREAIKGFTEIRKSHICSLT